MERHERETARIDAETERASVEQEKPVDATSAAKKERRMLDDAKEYAVSALRSGRRLGRNALAALALAEASLITTEVLQETPAASAEEPATDAAAERIAGQPMFSAEASAYFRERDAEVYLRWLSNEPGRRAVDVLNDSFEIAEVVRFPETKPARAIEIALEERSSLPEGVIAENARDRFGNHMRVIRATRDGKSEVQARIDLVPAFSDDAMSREYDVSADLSAIGGPVLERMAVGRTVPLIARTGPEGAYGMHASTEHAAAMQEAVVAHEALVGAAIADVESAFGMQPGDAVKHLWIVDEDTVNAYASANATGEFGAMMISDEVFKDAEARKNKDLVLDDEQRRTIIRHEALHLVDRKLHIAEEVTDLFAASNEAVLRRVSEGEFVGAWGGHAHWNEREMFAGVMNDVMDDRWDMGVANLAVGEVRDFRALLGGLEQRLPVIAPQLKDAPIMARLRERIESLDRRLTR